jgi:hypothetical protein
VNAVRERLLLLAGERVAGPHDDRPERPSPEDGKGVPPGWYPDPAGGPGRRFWDGARWANQVAVPTSHPSRANQRSRRIGLNIGLVVVGIVAVGVVAALAFLVVPPYVAHDSEVRHFRKTLDAMAPSQVRLVSEDTGAVLLQCFDTCSYPTRRYSTPWSRKQTYETFAAALERFGYRCVRWCDGFDEMGRSYLTRWQRPAGQPMTLQFTVDYANANDDLQCFKGGCDPRDSTRPAEAEISITP